MRSPRILVPLDGSALSEAILPFMSALGAPVVTLLRVVPHGERNAAHAERFAAEFSVTEAADRLRERGVTRVTPIVRGGVPAAVIAEVASEIGADLVALTTHGRSGFDPLVLGSVAERVIRTAAPVLALRAAEPAVVGSRTPRLLEHVLVPYDGSEHAWRTLQSLALLGAAGQGRVTLLGVVEAERGDDAKDARPPADIVARYRRLQRDALREQLEQAAAQARELGLEATCEVGVGRPATKILDRAEALEASLIALGTHGRSGISRWALGSVAEQVLRAASGPVLICR